MQEPENDAPLLAAIGSGSEIALSTLYERHRRAVYAQAYVETGARADAEEMLQDTFLTLWQKRHRVRLVGGSALPWLLVTAKNLSRNRRRYQGRRIAYELDETPTGDESDPLALAERRELRDLVAAALASLDPLDQQIVRLCLVDGLSYQQAAKHLDSTHAAVRNRLSRARKSTRTRLESELDRGAA